MKKRGWIFSLAVCLLLAGCSANRSAEAVRDERMKESTTQEAAVTEAESTEAESSETETIEPAQIGSASFAAEDVAPEKELKPEPETKDAEEPLMTEDGKYIVDLVLFLGQSNMAGAGGNAAYAPKVPYEHGYEFRAISDPTRLYPIEEPFGVNENNLNAIMDLPGAKKGSLVSSFANTYYAETKVPIVAVSASAGDTNTKFWMSERVAEDYTERLKRAVVWLENDKYEIRYKYVIWLQGESDAISELSTEQYVENMDTIIRPLFIGGVQKVFFITPGRTITRKAFFNDIIEAQIKMGMESGYYAVGTTILSAVSTEYMVDEWHYNQTVLNLLGEECAKTAAYYTNYRKEPVIYDYFHQRTLIPEGFDYDAKEEALPADMSKLGLKTNLE